MAVRSLGRVPPLTFLPRPVQPPRVPFMPCLLDGGLAGRWPVSGRRTYFPRHDGPRRGRYPRATKQELLLRLAVLRLGADVVERVYGWRAPADDA